MSEKTRYWICFSRAHASAFRAAAADLGVELEFVARNSDDPNELATYLSVDIAPGAITARVAHLLSEVPPC